MRFCSSVLIALMALAVPAFGQAKYPPPPAKYRVDLRYKIATVRDQRVREYRALLAALDKIGFVADPREDADLDAFDPTAERLAGTIPAADAGKLLDIAAIKTSILRDAGDALPDDAAAAVPIRALIPAGLSHPEQRIFHEQVVAQLGRLGLIEAVGYDHANFTIIRGSIPSGRVPDLLRDLRDLPSGWFFSEIPRDQLNLPLRDILPIRQVRVLKPFDAGPTVAPPAALPPTISSPKYSLDLAAYLANPANLAKPVRVELLMSGDLPDGARAFRELLRMRVPTVALEGVFGSFAVVRAPTAPDLVRIAEIPSVLRIRLPRLAALQPDPPATDIAHTMKAANLNALHANGYRGAGSRVVVLAVDFPGVLPRGARLIDLTAELSPTLEPLPAGTGTGGTATANAVRSAAPDADLTLVRLDPIAVHQLIGVTKSVLGDASPSVALVTRGDELIAESERLGIRRDLVQDEYRKAFSDLSDDAKPAKRRQDAEAAFKALEANEKVFKAKYDRLAALNRQIASLRGAQVIVNTLVWEDGYAHDALSEISRMLESRLTPIPTRSGLRQQKISPAPVWVQAGSTSSGSVWSGAFLDADGNGVMEFAPESGKPIPETWTRELNFLTVLGRDGNMTTALPAGATIRLSVQWREPRDPDTELSGLASFPFTLKLLRQLDPTGTTMASDQLTVVAQSQDPATRIQRSFTSAIFEQTLEIAIPAAGRYALRVEGKLATQTLAATNRSAFELRPRIYATFTGSATAAGRLMFATFAPGTSGVAIPGDARAAITVGVGGGLTGAGPGILLGRKPDVVVAGIDSPTTATGLVAGTTACLIDAGMHSSAILKWLVPNDSGTLKLPADWVQMLPARTDNPK